MYYVTYVQIYEATPQVVYVGYTPGYLGTVVVAVRHGRLRHRLRLLAVDRHRSGMRRRTPTASPRRRSTTRRSATRYGFALGLATAAWMDPYWGGALLPPRLLGRLSVLRVGERQRLRPLGQHDLLGHAQLVRGRRRRRHTCRGTYYNSRTGTTGNINAGRQYNAWTGNATRGYDRTFNTAAGGSGNVARASNYNTYTGQRSTGQRGLGHRRRRQHLRPRRRDHRRAAGRCARRRRLDLQRQDRQDQHLGHGERRQQPLRRRQRQRVPATPAAAGSSTRRAAGAARRATRRGPTASRRRAAPATTASAASAKRARWRDPASAVVDSAVAIASAAVASAAVASVATASAAAALAAVVGAGDSAVAVSAAADSAAAAASAAERDRLEEAPCAT